ncbi:MAG: hypothetical protein JJW01_01540 [Alphaproteobacteria bacterium]|nr:hypothetical protein [Rickettsiales bacterium]
MYGKNFSLKIKYYICLLITLVGVVLFFFGYLFFDRQKISYLLKKRGVHEFNYHKYSRSVDGTGCTIDDLFAGGIKDYRSVNGLSAVACASEDYLTVFSDVLRDLIGAHNKIKSGFRNKGNVDELKVIHLNIDPNNKYIIRSWLTVSRNLSNMPFRRAQSQISSHRSALIIKNAFEFAKFKNVVYVDLGRLPSLPSTEEISQKSAAEKCALTVLDSQRDIFDLFESKNTMPENIGMLFKNDASLCALVNGEDHLLVRSNVIDKDFADSMKRMYHFLDSLDLEFSIHRKYGYLTSRPENVGTGFTVNFVLKLPNLANNPKVLKNLTRSSGLLIWNIPNEGGNVFLLQNKVKINITEVDILNKTILQVAELLQTEEDLKQY